MLCRAGYQIPAGVYEQAMLQQGAAHLTHISTTARSLVLVLHLILLYAKRVFVVVVDRVCYFPRDSREEAYAHRCHKSRV